ncbi:MAG: hypothetical protein MJ153_01585 [Clostridia bacterium]|nr:hypothetical protein [Clostridia bacterium]
MGSSIEAAVVMSVILLVLTFLIAEPLNIVSDCCDSEAVFMENLNEHMDNSVIYEEDDQCIISGPEKLCTALTGISDSYQLIYDGITDYLTIETEGDDSVEEQ